jgi:hypothetical protein
VIRVGPVAGKQYCARRIDSDQSQKLPSGRGNLLGTVLRPDGRPCYHAWYDMNSLMEAR